MKIKLLLSIVVLSILFSCTYKSKPDISNIRLKVSVKPFNKDLFLIDTLNMNEGLKSMSQKYGNYWLLYNIGVIETGNPKDENFPFYIENFIKDKSIREINDTCVKVFSDISSIESELSLSFRYLKYYIPKIKIPDVYFHISGFNQSIIVDSNIVSVSIDNYLGEKCKFYDMIPIPIPLYARENMSKERIPYDVMQAIAMTTFPFEPKRANLISNMIYHGKIFYFMSKMFPNSEESEIVGYNELKYKWSEDNESSVWAFFIENNYLYSSDFFVISKYINNAPYSSGMPIESPGKVSTWIGLQIVKEFMKSNNVSLIDLMNNNDYEDILRESNYQPE